MFLPDSRYAQVATVTTRLATGEEVEALKLRKPLPVSGTPRRVRSGDRIDLIAHEIGAGATKFWHVADANCALDSRTLVAEPGDTLDVPGS